MEDIINSISSYGYIIIFFYSLGGGFFALVGGAILASIGKLDILLVILTAGISNMVGDIFLFYLGRYHKKDITHHHFFIKHRRKFAYSKILIKRSDIFAIFLQKYIYGVKTIVPILLGLINYNFSKFALLNLFASLIWAISIGFSSFYFANGVREFFNEYQIHPLLLPILFLFFLFLFWKWIDKKIL